MPGTLPHGSEARPCCLLKNAVSGRRRKIGPPLSSGRGPNHFAWDPAASSVQLGQRAVVHACAPMLGVVPASGSHSAGLDMIQVAEQPPR